MSTTATSVPVDPAKTPKMPPIPELERLVEHRPQSDTIGEFLEWLENEKGVVLAARHKHHDGCRDKEGNLACGLTHAELVRLDYTADTLLAEYFQIDLRKVEKERRALLKWTNSGGQK